MSILALDPSATCTGYAVLDGGRVVEGGRLRGKRGTDAVARILAMRTDLVDLLGEFDPDVVVIEIPTGKQYTTHKARQSAMAVWALAAGALWAVAVDWAASRNAGLNDECSHVYPVSNTAWTRGKSKAERQATVKAFWRDYDPAMDPGMDLSDAVALALWWEAESKRMTIQRTVRP